MGNFKDHPRVVSVFIIIILLTAPRTFSQTLNDKVNSILSQMTLEEKILQLHEEGGFNTADNTRLGIPGFYMADGPHGVRDDSPATSFPVGIGMAATWNPDMITIVGEAMGREFLAKAHNQALGPCMDLNRDPRNGRSAESGGEDPYLISKITSALIKGIQNTGVIATAKHFNCVNRQENRTNNNVTISQRFLMEHYGLNFRNAVQDGGAFSVMNAYNLINNQKCAENPNLLSGILRDYWGFPYYVVSDWNSIWNSENAIEAGCNICMGSDMYENDLLNLVQSGAVSEDTINDAVRKVLRTKMLAGMLDNYPVGNPDDLNSTVNREAALESGRQSLVLLKNEDNILPLDKNNITSIALIGPSADVCQLDGCGSSYVTPFYTITPKQGIEEIAGPEMVHYTKGCDINSTDISDLPNALNLAAAADIVIYVGGLDNTQEGEGLDRVGNSVMLPGKQIDVINALAGVNQNLIVVLESGGIVAVSPAIANIKGLIYGFYPGQEGGRAIADVLFGNYNPGGKLPVTMPVANYQLPERNDDFTDDFLCGYRWYDEQNYIPQFSFGFGLSYTTFEYSSLAVPSSSPAGQIVPISVDVKNTGSLKGDEVVQLYISDNESSVWMPEKQLKGFKRITLEPGEQKTVTFNLTAEEFYYFDETENNYKIEPGTFTIKAGGSSDNLPLTASLNITDAAPQPDLMIANISSFPKYPAEGDSVVFLAAILNRGTQASSSGTVHEVIFKVNGAEVSRSSEFSGSIKPGGMMQVSATIYNNTNWWIAGEPGTYTVEAVVDPDNNISECIENNNSISQSFTVVIPPPENIALHKEVTVSSIESQQYAGEYAVDGNRGTRWSSQFSDPQFIYVDLGSLKHVAQVNLTWETAYGKEYSIETSNDAVSWNEVYHQTEGDGGIDRIYFSADCRYVRMYGIHRGTVYGYSLYEFEIFSVSDNSSDVEEAADNVFPSSYNLFQNYPNPFNPSTTFRFSVMEYEGVVFNIYNSLGELVDQLVNKELAPGTYELNWDASYFASGIYFYSLRAGSFFQTRKMNLLK